jgi:peroxiredoxin
MRTARVRRAASRRMSLLVVLIAAAIGPAGSQSPSAAKDLLNKPAPGFALTTLSGQPLRLSKFRGNVVLLNFWATWCAPCQVEMPTFAAWQRQYGAQGLQVIGISMDDDAASARRVVNRLKVDYPIAMGTPQLAERYGGVLGLPLTYLIDRHGIIRARLQGVTDSKVIEKQMKQLFLSAP